MFDNIAAQSKKPLASSPSMTPMPKKAPIAPAERGLRKGEDVRRCERFINNYSRVFGLVIILFLVLVIVGLAASYYLNVNVLNSKINQINSEYKQKQILVQSFSGLSSNLDEIETSSANFDKMLPQEKDLSQVLVKLEQMASKYELVFNSINNTSTEIMVRESASEKIKKQQYEIVLSSSDYFTLKSYLSDIEKNMRIIDVRSLVYSPDVNMFFLNFEVYYLD
jgi:Tfp pilus assembly protein PilO